MVVNKLIKGIDKNGSKVSFRHHTDLKCLVARHKPEACPTKLELISAQIKNGKWAILQTFEEQIAGRNPYHRIDGTGFDPTCFNDDKRSNTLPPYLENYLSNFYSDQPTYDCTNPGRLLLSTIFTFMKYSDPPDDFKATYEVKFGVHWGITLDSYGNYNSIPARLQENKEIEHSLEIFREEYKDATFVIGDKFEVKIYSNDKS